MKTNSPTITGKLFYLFLLLSFANCLNSKAANKYWIGSVASNWNNTANWSTASGGASGAGVPGAGDIANFDGNGLGNCSIDAIVNIAGINVAAAYTGIISQNTFAIMVGASNAVFSGGIFAGGSAAITFTGIYTLSGTSFTSTSGNCIFESTTTFSSGSFSHNNGTVTIGAALLGNFTVTGSFTFYNLTVIGSYNTITLANSNTVSNNFTLNATSAGDININLSTITVNKTTSLTGVCAVRLMSGTLVALGDVISSFTGPTYNQGIGTILFSGTTNQLLSTISPAGQGELPNITINKTAGTGTLTLSGTNSFYGNWTYTAGTVDVVTNTSTVESVGPAIVNTAGTSSAMSFYNLTAGANSSITMASNFTILNNLTLITPASTTYFYATNNGYTLTIGGNFSGQPGTSFSQGNSTVVFNGSSLQTILFDANAGYQNIFYNLTVANTSGGLKLLTNNFQVTNNLTLTSGAVNLNGLTLTLGTTAFAPGLLTYSGGWLYGGTFMRWLTHGTAVTIPSTTALFPMGSSTDYCPLWLGYSVSLTTGGTVSVNFNPYTIASPGNPTISIPIDTIPGNIPSQAGEGIIDPTWGKTYFSVTSSYWSIATGNGFAPNGSTLSLRYGGGTTTFFTNTLSDLAAETAMRSIGSTDPIYGSWATSTNAAVVYEVNRTGVSLAGLTNANNWRIGTTNTVNSPLPISLIGFSAISNENKVDLKWETATETNNAYFTIEKSKDGKFFTKLIDDVPGADNSINYRTYAETDYQPYTGTSYYRLKQTDKNGNYKYLSVVPVNFNVQQNITVYPNPADVATQLHVNVSGCQNQEVIIVLNDMQGREFLSKVLLVEANNQTFIIDETQSLLPGTYIITATSDNKIYNHKLIVK